MVLKKIYSAFVFLAACGLSFTVQSKQDVRIDYQPIAVVNDVSVTPYDLTKRIKLLRFLNNVPKNAAVTQQDKVALLRNIIDEVVKAQETQRFDVTISSERMDEYIENLARQRRMSKESFLSEVEAIGINRQEIEKIFSRQLAWTDLRVADMGVIFL